MHVICRRQQHGSDDDDDDQEYVYCCAMKKKRKKNEDDYYGDGYRCEVDLCLNIFTFGVRVWEEQVDAEGVGFSKLYNDTLKAPEGKSSTKVYKKA